MLQIKENTQNTKQEIGLFDWLNRGQHITDNHYYQFNNIASSEKLMKETIKRKLK